MKTKTIKLKLLVLLLSALGIMQLQAQAVNDTTVVLSSLSSDNTSIALKTLRNISGGIPVALANEIAGGLHSVTYVGELHGLTTATPPTGATLPTDYVWMPLDSAELQVGMLVFVSSETMYYRYKGHYSANGTTFSANNKTDAIDVDGNYWVSLADELCSSVLDTFEYLVFQSNTNHGNDADVNMYVHNKILYEDANDNFTQDTDEKSLNVNYKVGDKVVLKTLYSYSAIHNDVRVYDYGTLKSYELTSEGWRCISCNGTVSIMLWDSNDFPNLRKGVGATANANGSTLDMYGNGTDGKLFDLDFWGSVVYKVDQFWCFPRQQAQMALINYENGGGALYGWLSDDCNYSGVKLYYGIDGGAMTGLQSTNVYGVIDSLNFGNTPPLLDNFRRNVTANTAVGPHNNSTYPGYVYIENTSSGSVEIYVPTCIGYENLEFYIIDGTTPIRVIVTTIPSEEKEFLASRCTYQSTTFYPSSVKAKYNKLTLNVGGRDILIK